MPKDVFGIICAGSESEQLRTLISRRDVASLPIGGRYRIIDFLLSNMVNSNISNIGILTKKNCQSIMDHVGAGKEWDLDRKNGGLFILPPFDTSEGYVKPEGMLDELKNAERFIDKEPQPYCLICKASVVYNNTYDKMFEQHLETGADITIMYNIESPSADKSEPTGEQFVLRMDDTGRVTDIQYSPIENEECCRSMECLLIHKELLKYLMDNAYSYNKHNQLVDVIKDNLSNLKVYGYKHEGYSARITSVANYFKASMDMLKPKVLQDLFYTGNNVYTKTKDEPPTHYGEHASVENSMIASGCSIEGTVENSIIFRGVHVGKDVKIKDSVIMQNSQIYDNSVLDKVILDKNAVIRPNSQLIGTVAYPVVIPKGGIV